MKPSCAFIHEPRSYIDRIVRIDRLTVVVSLGKPNAFSTKKVDCRKNQHSRKFLRICKPTVPLFSGWNWVP